ncbi:Eukaryotic aspartyl protease [Aphelenchoides fujianensis]|nr:Eukaryotic aspartyl protease [Aphelenchoides fujianensis]
MDGARVLLLLALAGVAAHASIVTVPLSNFHDVVYRGDKISAVFHTGCTLTRFPKKGCVAEGRFPEACKTNTYDPKASRTAREQMWRTFEVTEVEYTHFGSRGEQFYDTLSFYDPKRQSTLSLRNADVGASTKVWAFDHAVVCLAHRARGMTNGTFTDLVNSRQLNHQWMTVALKKANGISADGGAITFGGPDNERCESVVWWTPVVTGSFMWRFRVNTFGINAMTFRNIFVMANVDTGNSYMHIPGSYWSVVKRELKITKRGSYHTVPCDSKFKLTFSMGGHTFPVTEEHLVLNQQIDGQCVVALKENEYKDDMFILGSAFFRAVCVIHDLQNEKLGFAHHRKL